MVERVRERLLRVVPRGDEVRVIVDDVLSRRCKIVTGHRTNYALTNDGGRFLSNPQLHFPR